MTTRQPEISLDALRQEIDAIDGDLLRLLIRRFETTDRVRANKAFDGSLGVSPLRPAREATMLRRLISESRGSLSPDLIVQLWRVILSASIQSQAPVTLHMAKTDEHDMVARTIVAQHFFGISVLFHDGVNEVIQHIRQKRGDLAVLAAGSGWGDDIFSGDPIPTQIVATLPALASGAEPQLFVLGHVDPQPSGDDETLLLLPPNVPMPSSRLWHMAVGRFVLVSLPGFLAVEVDPLREYLRHRPGVRVAGRCPRPIRYEHANFSE
jgi:chorismate mutase